jgi:hypothetical protein
MDNTTLIEALKRVPETKLRLIAIVREATKEDGSLDIQKLTFDMAELRAAIDEARAYAESVRKTVSCLKNLNRLST